MMMKRCLAILLCLVLGLTIVPTTALADEEVYTVILDSGDGTGDQIVYSAKKSDMTTNGREVGNCGFLLEKDGTVIFRMNEDYCPDSFSAPNDGMELANWKGQQGEWMPISPGITTFTAIWKPISVDKRMIADIPVISNGGIYKIGEYEWKLIGKSESRGTGLLVLDYDVDINSCLKCNWAMSMLICDGVFGAEHFKEGKGLVIPTYKEVEEYVLDGVMYQSRELNDAKMFPLSANEAEYYNVEARDGHSWWTRTSDINATLGLVVKGKSIEKSRDDGEEYKARPAFQVDLKKLEEFVSTQSLPPALPEGTFLSKKNTYKITNKNKKEVQMIEGTVSAKGAITIPRTVTYEKKKYKVTSLSGMLFDGNSELKTINITAGNLKKIGKYAFRFINKKAVFKIKGSKKQFNKIKKLIKASKGLPKGVKFKRVK